MPIAVKDNFLTTGAPTTYGSSILREHSPVGDADVVARLRDAGAILVGKTNMNEFAWGLDPAVGRVNNPFDPSLTAGGSSGGSVAAVASGNLVAAIGTDSGGSVRMPAAFCRVVGVKPTHGLVPVGRQASRLLVTFRRGTDYAVHAGRDHASGLPVAGEIDR